MQPRPHKTQSLNHFPVWPQPSLLHTKREGMTSALLQSESEVTTTPSLSALTSLNTLKALSVKKRSWQAPRCRKIRCFKQATVVIVGSSSKPNRSIREPGDPYAIPYLRGRHDARDSRSVPDVVQMERGLLSQKQMNSECGFLKDRLCCIMSYLFNKVFAVSWSWHLNEMQSSTRLWPKGFPRFCKSDLNLSQHK